MNFVPPNSTHHEIKTRRHLDDAKLGPTVLQIDRDIQARHRPGDVKLGPADIQIDRDIQARHRPDDVELGPMMSSLVLPSSRNQPTKQ